MRDEEDDESEDEDEDEDTIAKKRDFYKEVDKEEFF